MTGDTIPIVNVDATKWRSVLDLYDALYAVIGVSKGYARNINALLEAMLWDYAFPETNYSLNPPYSIHIHNAKSLPNNIRDEIDLIGRCLSEGCVEFRTRQYGNIDVGLEIVS